MTIRKAFAVLPLVFLGLAASVSHGFAAEHSLAFKHLNPLLKAYLQKELGPPDATSETSYPTRAVSAAIPLSDSRTEVLVYVTGLMSRGSGGCTLLILEFDGKNFRKIGDVGGWAPVRVIEGAYGQHPDLTINVHGGGVVPGYVTKIRYAHGHYPDSPIVSGPPLNKPNAGTLMINWDDKGELVFK